MVFSDLRWGKNQCLYRAPPWHVIYNPNTGMHEMIKPWITHQDNDTNSQLVRLALSAEMSHYPLPPMDSEKVKTINLELRTVDRIETILYPTAFYCSKCHKLVAEDPGHTVRSISEAVERLRKRLQPGLKCECGGHFNQWNVLTIHTCGEMIHVPTFFFVKCPTHGYNYLRFDQHGSERFSAWEISCTHDGCETRKGYPAFFYSHKDCVLKNSPGMDSMDERFWRYETAPIQKATNFLPRVLKILNSEEITNAPRPGSEQAFALALGALRAEEYFSHFNPHSGMDLWRDRFNPKGQIPDPNIDAALKIVEKMPEGETKSGLLSHLKKSRPAASGLIGDAELARLCKSHQYLVEAASISVYQDSRRSSGIDDLLSDESLHQDSRTKLEDAKSRAKIMKIKQVRHVEDIALTSCLIGYTRGDYQPERVMLRLYSEQRASGKLVYTAYTSTVKSEGLFVQLDPTELLKRLSEITDERLNVNGDFTTDLFQIQKRFEPRANAFNGPSDLWSRTYYSILHTFSHLLIKNLGKYSGLEQEGLTELIYPYQSSVLVFSNDFSTDFSLGGLEMAFEHHLKDILSGMQEDADTCPYNPECEAQLSACPACVYIAEVSCENFNRVLSRAHLSRSKKASFWN